MPYLFFPKLTKNCPSVSHCPHLGGAALGGVVHSANANDEWLQSLLRQIDGLREESRAKSGRIEELQERVEQLDVAAQQNVRSSAQLNVRYLERRMVPSFK